MRHVNEGGQLDLRWEGEGTETSTNTGTSESSNTTRHDTRTRHELEPFIFTICNLPTTSTTSLEVCLHGGVGAQAPGHLHHRVHAFRTTQHNQDRLMLSELVPVECTALGVVRGDWCGLHHRAICTDRRPGGGFQSLRHSQTGPSKRCQVLSCRSHSVVVLGLLVCNRVC